MSDEFASFRELRGIGPAIETRLHEAGVHTWQALSDVLLALHGIRGRTGDTLRDLAELAAARAESSPDASPGASAGVSPGALPGTSGDDLAGVAQRSESFLVRVALSAESVPSRTSITRVRTNATHSNIGWSPDLVVRFVEEAVGLPASATFVDDEPRVSVPAPAETMPLGVPEPPGVPELSGVPEPLGVPELSGSLDRVEPVREHSAVLLVGTVIGGGECSFTATMSAAGVPAGEGFSYEALLISRLLGAVDPDPRHGVLLDRRTGQGWSSDPLELMFSAAAVPAGIQRLRLLVTVRLSRPVPGPLYLGLELTSAASSAAMARDSSAAVAGAGEAIPVATD